MVASALERKLKGQHIVGDNGSVAVIERLAVNLRDHAHVSIIRAVGHHKQGDNLVWAIPEAMLRAARQPSPTP